MLKPKKVYTAGVSSSLPPAHLDVARLHSLDSDLTKLSHHLLNIHPLLTTAYTHNALSSFSDPAHPEAERRRLGERQKEKGMAHMEHSLDLIKRVIGDLGQLTTVLPSNTAFSDPTTATGPKDSRDRSKAAGLRGHAPVPPNSYGFIPPGGIGDVASNSNSPSRPSSARSPKHGGKPSQTSTTGNGKVLNKTSKWVKKAGKDDARLLALLESCLSCKVVKRDREQSSGLCVPKGVVKEMLALARRHEATRRIHTQIWAQELTVLRATQVHIFVFDMFHPLQSL